MPQALNAAAILRLLACGVSRWSSSLIDNVPSSASRYRGFGSRHFAMLLSRPCRMPARTALSTPPDRLAVLALPGPPPRKTAPALAHPPS